MATLSQLCLIMAPLDSETDSDLEEFPPTDPEEIRGHGLPWDILLYLMKFLDMRELSYLMRTCRTLYEHGIQILLTAHAPRLVFMAEYLSFCRFMLRCTRRPSLLRGLHLVDPLPSSRFATDDAHTIMTALADVISQAVNLENLEVDGMYTKLNDPDTGYLWPAITSLERLRIVNLSNVYPRILHSLESMRSSVQELTIEMDHPDYPMAYDETPLLQYLKPFAGSLRKLRLCSLIQTLQEVDITPLESVHTLMVDPVFTRRINLDTLVFTFPNVQSLKIDTGFIEEDEDENWDLDVARFYQEESLSMRWPCLENLVCPVEWAYTSVLGKVTYWKRVHVGGNICKDVGDHVEQFKTVLSDIRPAYLDLMLDLCDPDILDAYLFPELDSITHLNLDLLKLQEAFIRGEEFWLELLIVRRHSNLTYLRTLLISR
ncbi:hypothetical protein BXZ70DRAFT_948526 [Cristinia sonorae]|uniref:F-box domain-containing protein n=1 Tax=Cristinia sonorae TaxID=1940300 RepID=A0A8K0UJP3_9AGAR|nr:hypothetical protein BXZ70DRAFT_948526 [Cristinia sonorae]